MRAHGNGGVGKGELNSAHPSKVAVAIHRKERHVVVVALVEVRLQGQSGTGRASAVVAVHENRDLSSPLGPNVQLKGRATVCS